MANLRYLPGILRIGRAWVVVGEPEGEEMKAAVYTLSALLLLSAALNVIQGREIRGLQLVGLERLCEISRLEAVLFDKAGDVDRERMWREDTEYLYGVIAAHENRLQRRLLPSRRVIDAAGGPE